MNKHSLDELKIMQNLPLEIKIAMSLNRIRFWYQHFGGDVYVSFSGGKDSTVLLDLVRRNYPSVPAVFVDTGLEYPEVRQHVKAASNVTWLKPTLSFPQTLEQYGYPVVSKMIARTIYYARKGSYWALQIMKGLNYDGTYSKFRQRYVKYQYLLEAPFAISDNCCEVMKKKPFALFEKENGAVPFIGTMAEESFLRQQSWLKTGCNAFDSKKPKSTPLSFWTEQDILSYLKTEKLPFATVYGDLITTEQGAFSMSGLKRTGCMFCMFGVHREKEPNRFQKMKQTHPKLYDYCIGSLGCGKVLEFMNIPYS